MASLTLPKDKTLISAFSSSTPLENDRICTDSPRDRAYLQPLCDVPVVVYLVHYARGKPYLVPVAAVAVCRSDYNFALGKLAGNSLFKRQSRVCGPSDAHCLVYIASA